MEPSHLTGTEKPKQSFIPAGDDLELYRRLVETQKQVIELTKRCEHSKSELKLLRERARREAIQFTAPQCSLTRRVLRMVVRVFHAMETGVTIRHDERSSQS